MSFSFHLKGIKPISFEKIESPEIKEIIEQCIRLDKEERPDVKDLLAHDFFAEDTGLKIDLVCKDAAVAGGTGKVEFRLRVVDAKKRGNKYKENEAIQFDFDIETDNPEEVALEMVILRQIFILCF